MAAKNVATLQREYATTFIWDVATFYKDLKSIAISKIIKSCITCLRYDVAKFLDFEYP